MGDYMHESYTNEFHQRAVEHLHTRTKHTAVVACSNSNIDVYLTRGSLSAIPEELGPYDIDRVKPLPDSETFECKVTLTADWTEVDFDGGDE